MKFGLSFLPDAEPAVKSPSLYFAEALALSQLAEDAGLEYVKMTEHYQQPYGGYCPSPLAFLAAVAGVTRRIRLMTGCVLPAFHHPVEIAAVTSMVDAISGGRLDVGFARAYMPYEFEAFGVPIDESRDRFVATVAAVIRLWREPEVTMQTPFFTLDQARNLPPPTQHPMPPVWVAASRSRQSFAWIGEQGFGLMATPLLTTLAEIREMIAIYRESFVPAHPGDRPRIAISQPLLIAPTDAEAIALHDRYLGDYFRVWADAADAWNRTRSADYLGYTGMSHAIRGTPPSALRQNGCSTAGTVERVSEHLERLAAELDPEVVLWQVDFGAMPFEIATRTVTSFAQCVAPAWRHSAGGREYECIVRQRNSPRVLP